MNYRTFCYATILFMNSAFAMNLGQKITRIDSIDYSLSSDSQTQLSPVLSQSDRDATAELMDVMQNGKVARLISFDGGGIRGIFSAVIAKFIEDQVNQPISDLFHLAAGTSTGGIIAGMLTMQNDERTGPKFSATDIVDLYTQQGAAIFDKICWFKNIFRGFRSGYDTGQFELLLNDYCGETKLSDVKNDLIITYNDLQKGPSFFKSHFARQGGKYEDFLLRDVLRATSAAPTYFDPHHFQPIMQTGSQLELLPGYETQPPTVRVGLDGGMFANDPSLCALIESSKLYPSADAILLLSIGTGQCQVEKEEPSTIFGWASGCPDILISNASFMTRHMIKYFSAESRKRVFYVRVQTDINKGHEQLDNTTRANMEYLVNSGIQYTMDPTSPLRQIIPFLTLLTSFDFIFIYYKKIVFEANGQLSMYCIETYISCLPLLFITHILRRQMFRIEVVVFNKLFTICAKEFLHFSQSQWPSGVRHVLSTAARTQGLWFHSHSRHGCMSAFFCVMLSCVGRGLGRADLPSRESYQLSK